MADLTDYLSDMTDDDSGSYETIDTATPVQWDWNAVLNDATDFVTEIANNSLPGSDAYGWKYYTNGTAISPDGTYYLNGEKVYDPSTGTLSGFLGTIAKQGGSAIKNMLFKNGDPNAGVNLSGIVGAISAGNALFGDTSIQSAGWSAPPPKYEAITQQIGYDDANRRPGSGGRRYFTDVQYVPEGEDTTAATDAAAAQAQKYIDEAPSYSEPSPVQSKIPMNWNTPANFNSAAPTTAPETTAERGAMAEIDETTGGLVGLARGGQVPQFRGQLENNGFVLPGDVVAHADPMGRANKERGLRALHNKIGVEAIRGPGDAMSDSIPTTIDGREPARVANGEAYVPRQNVERMGNGDMDRGANRLHEIMNGLRQRRTGSTEQINPDNPQELRRAYGGSVKRFANGGTPAAVDSVSGYGASAQNTLSPYIGEYVTDALGKGAALADMPYQAYQGPLTAGASDLQTQAFAGAESLANTGFTPTQFTGGVFDTAAAQQYMNPYLAASLSPQLQELKRQADIERVQNAGRMTRAGSFGGSRQALMETEGQRNLLDKQRQALAEGYNTAYDKAMAQYNADQTRGLDAQKATEESRQYGADFARQSIKDLADLGATQRDIEQQGIDADKAQFEEERAWMYKAPQYKLNLLQGIPIGGTTTTPNDTSANQFNTKMNTLLASLASFGLIDPTEFGLPATVGATTGAATDATVDESTPAVTDDGTNDQNVGV